MKKTIIIILILLLVATSIVYLYIYNANKTINYAKQKNSEYEKFYNQEILGTTLISIINKAINDNENNNVPKQNDTIYYENNKSNSIQINIKFIDSEKIIKMEEIAQKQTENFVKVFATATFKCTQIEYHEKTKCISNMYFEQVLN